MKIRIPNHKTTIREITDQMPSEWWAGLTAEEKDQAQVLWMIIRILDEEQCIEIRKQQGKTKVKCVHKTRPLLLKKMKRLAFPTGNKKRWCWN